MFTGVVFHHFGVHNNQSFHISLSGHGPPATPRGHGPGTPRGFPSLPVVLFPALSLVDSFGSIWKICEPVREKTNNLVSIHQDVQSQKMAGGWKFWNCTIRKVLISLFVFTTLIVRFLYFQNSKFPTSSHSLFLYSSICIGPDRKPHCWFSHEVAHL